MPKFTAVVCISCLSMLVLFQLTPSAQFSAPLLADPQPEGIAAPMPRGTIPTRRTIPVQLTRTHRVGDVVARGNRIDRNRDGMRETCEADFGIRTPEMERGSYRVDLVADEDCAISIAHIEDNSTPPAQAATVVGPPSLIARLFNRLAELVAPALSAASGPKRVTSYTWMYGYGGTWDWLSETRGYIDWSWDGAIAWTNYTYNYCAAHTVTYWWMNGCWYQSQTWNGANGVEQTVQGNYFWAPEGMGTTPAGPHYYIHQVYNEMWGGKDGTSFCTGWYSGSIVYGVSNACFIAQPPPCGAGNLCFSTAPHTSS
jgi:hypothetical protein